MPRDQFSADQPWPRPPQKEGKGCGCKLLIFLGIVFALLVVVCCGGFVWMGYYFSKGVSEDPQVIASVTSQLVQIDIPEGLKPGFSFNMKMPFTGEPIMVWVVHVDKDTRSMLVLGSFGGPLAGQDQDQLWDQIEQSLEEQGLKHEENVREWERYEKEVDVRGEPVTLHFATGQDEDTEAQRIEVTGTFRGEKAPVMFSFFGDAEKYDEETIVKMIESIR